MRARTSRHRRGSRGISTAEVLAGSALTILTVGSIFTAQQAQLKAFATQSTYSQSQTLTRSVVDLISREVRMAGYNPTYVSCATPAQSGALTCTNALSGCPNLQQGVIEATPTRFHFRQDLNADGLITLAGEDVTYEFVNGVIQRTDTIGGVPVVLADNVPANGFRFRYYDNTNPPVELVPGGAPAALTVCQRPLITKVRVTLEEDLANPNPHVMTPVKSIAQTEVAIRSQSIM